MPRLGEQTFAELAAAVGKVDFGDQNDSELLERASEWVEVRLQVPVEAGVVLAELMRRGWSYIELEREIELDRRSILRWSEPFRGDLGDGRKRKREYQKRPRRDDDGGGVGQDAGGALEDR